MSQSRKVKPSIKKKEPSKKSALNKNSGSTGPQRGSKKKRTKQTQYSEKQFNILPTPDEEIRYDRLIKFIGNLIEKKHISILEKLLSNLRPFDISYISEFLSEDHKSIIFSLISNEIIADILPEMSKEIMSSFIQQRDPKWIAEVVDNMDSDDAADVLAELPEEKASFILKRIDKENASIIEKLLKYDENSAGGIMASEFLTVSHDASVCEVISEFKKLAEEEDIEDIHSSFVIDENGKLIGNIPLRKLVLYKGNTKVVHIMNTDLFTVNVNDDQEAVAAIFKRHNLISIPVLDNESHLVGRITIDDIVDVIEEETSEDIYRMAGVSGESSVHSSIRTNIGRRLPWLMVNLGTAAVSALVVSMYESVIDQVAILAAFMPIVAGLGGNAGSQVIAIAVRSLALGELTSANARKVLIREIVTGASNGIFLGLITGSATAIITGKIYLGIVITWAMVMNIFTATIAGLLVPLGLKKLKIDPAVASNIFVTPMTDALGFFFFLGLAKIFLDFLV